MFSRRKLWMLVALVCLAAQLVLALGAQARQISFWSGRYRDNDSVAAWIEKELLPRFAKEKRITVNHVRMSSGDLREQMDAGQSPDVLIVYGDPNPYGRAGLVQPLNRYFNSWNDRRHISANLITYDSDSKNLYGIPIEADLTGVAFNKTAFSKAGLSTTRPPASWEELRTAAEKTMLFWGGRIVRTGIETTWDVSAFQGFLCQLGETGLSPDLRQSRLASDNAVQTLEYLVSLYQLGYPPNDIFRSEPRSNDLYRKFAEGFTAMAFGGRTVVTYMQQRNPKWQQELGWFPARRYPSMKPVARASTRYIAISSKSRDAAAAWEFIKWLFSPEIAVLYHAQVQAIPTRTDLARQVTQQLPHLLPAYQALQYAAMLPNVPLLPTATRQESQQLQEQLRQLLKGQIDARALLREWQALAQVGLDRYWAEQDLARQSDTRR